MTHDDANIRRNVFKAQCKTCIYESCIGKHCQDCEVYTHDGNCYCNGQPTDGELCSKQCAKYEAKAATTYVPIAKAITGKVETTFTDAVLKAYSKSLTSVSVPSIASVDSKFEKLADRITVIETKLDKLIEMLSL